MPNFMSLAIYALVLGLVVAAVWLFKSTVLLVFLAVLLAILMNMPVQALTRIGVPRIVAVPIGILVCLGIIFLVFLAVIPSLVEVTGLLIDRFPNAIQTGQSFYEDLRTSFTWLPDSSALLQATNSISGGQVFSWVLNQVGGVAGMLGQALLLVVISVFLLIAPRDHRQILLRLFPAKRVHRVQEVLDMIYQGLTAWMRALGMSIAATFTLVFGAFTLLGFPFAFEIAVITGVATFIPTIGAILPIIPIVIFGLTAEDPWIILWALVVYLVIQQVEGNVITPSFHKAELNILPAGILLFQIIAAQIFGVLGILMAVPILVVVIILVRELYSRDLMGWKEQ